MKSMSNLGVIFVILINSLLSTLPPALTFLIVLRMNGSSYSPEPPSILGEELVYGGSGPLISSSLTPNGLTNQRSKSNNSTNGKQQIHNIFGTLSIPIPSSLSQIPLSSSSIGIWVLFLGSVEQSISLVSFQPSLSSSLSSMRSINAHSAELTAY